jgi:integrase
MLTDVSLKALAPRAKRYKKADERGLYVMVNPDGSRWWRLKYRYQGREKTISLGVYPDTSLKLARERRDEARRLLGSGLDPSAKRREEKAARANDFKAVALEWLGKQPFGPKTLKKARWMFEDLMFPHLGSKPVASITAPEILAVLRRLESRNKHETAHRTRQRIGQVLRYAVATGRAQRDPSWDLRGALAPIDPKNHPAIVDPARVGELLRAIDGYSGQPAVEAALKLAPLLFVRPGELRAAEWSELSLSGDAPEWRIAAHRMKMKEQHIVPLARQAVAILRELEPITGAGRYCFPSLRTSERPMSDAALTAALRRMGYSGDEMTWHGFRSMASTLLNEQNFPPDVIELQLAHVERNKVRSAYNKAQRLPERRKMMQAWADYLDGLRAGGKVVAIRAAGREKRRHKGA